MSRCAGCEHAVFEQYAGYKGSWYCFHPYRREIDNNGNYTFPPIDSPKITICKTLLHENEYDALQKAKTPKWCYIEAEERAIVEQPSFNPAAQRSILFGGDNWKELYREAKEGA